MTKPTDGTMKFIKQATAILVLIAAASTVGGLILQGKVQDTVETAITKNDQVDDGKFCSNVKATEIETNLTNLKEDVQEVKSDLKDVKVQMNEQIRLLYIINAKLNKDST